jgi:signal transduction histidine kinase
MNPKTTAYSYSELDKIITGVYFSNLRYKLKNDVVCRLIAEAGVFGPASFVSILLIDATDDMLSNFGHYTNPAQSGITFNGDPVKDKFMLENIAVYEYFAHKYETNTVEDCSFEDYTSMPYFSLSNISPRLTGLSKEAFQQIQTDFFTIKEPGQIPVEYKRYKNYKGIIARTDSYELRPPTTPSGTYFNDLVLGNVKTSEKGRKFLDSSSITYVNKTLIKVYEEKLNIKPQNNSIYLAIPLHVNNRYDGLIRVLYHSDDIDKTINEKIRVIEDWLKNNNENELEELAAMIALHIGNSYATHEFKQVSYKRVLDTFDNEDKRFNDQGYLNNSIVNILGEYCEALRRTINCRAAIFRTGTKMNSLPVIKGWTNSVDHYINNISDNDHFANHVNQLESIFNPVTPMQKDGRNITLIGIQFNVDPEGIRNIQVLYFTDDEILNATTDPIFVTKYIKDCAQEIFDGDVRQKLCAINLNQVVLIKIPFIRNGYFSFANTIYRPFIKNDINIIYPQIHRLGTELHIRQFVILEKQATFLEKLCHEMQVPVSIAYQKAGEMNRRIETLVKNGFSKTDQDGIIKDIVSAKTTLPKQFEFLLKLISSRLFIYSVANDYERDRLRNDEVIGYSMTEQVYNLILIFREDAFSRFEGLGIVKDWEDNQCMKEINLNDTIFNCLFFYLMDNAIKYSFTLEQRLANVPEYDTNFNLKTDGHIKVKCFNTAHEYGFSITNWGKSIPKEYIHKVRQLKERAPMDLEFESKDNPVPGKGLGLYYATKYAELTGGKLIIISEGCKTQINVTWKNQLLKY